MHVWGPHRLGRRRGGSETAARGMVPVLVRSKARVVEVGKFTPEQIKSFHGMGR